MEQPSERPPSEEPGSAGQPPASQTAPASGPGAVGRAVEPVVERVVEPVVDRVVEPVLGRVVEPVVGRVIDRVVEPAVGGIVGGVRRAGQRQLGRRRKSRRLRQLSREPLPNLYELYPEARNAAPRELGVRFVPLEEIRGSAVAGPAQRAADFLPFKHLRGSNWRGRWDRISEANAHLLSLPPIDLIKYDGGYWVLDGHNRVAAALQAGGAGLDAVVTELVPLDTRSSERPSALGGLLGRSGELRAAAQGLPPSAEEHLEPHRDHLALEGVTDLSRPWTATAEEGSGSADSGQDDASPSPDHDGESRDAEAGR